MAKEKNNIVKLDKNEQEAPKLQTIQIEFEPYLFEAENHEPTVLTFENIIGHQIGQHWVAIIKADENIIYPAAGIRRIRVINNQ